MVTPLPDTECPTCRQVEMTWWQRWKERRDQGKLIFTGMGVYYSNMISMAMGVPVKTWYDRHRERYEETGDEKELMRMERHIK